MVLTILCQAYHIDSNVCFRKYYEKGLMLFTSNIDIR